MKKKSFRDAFQLCIKSKTRKMMQLFAIFLILSIAQAGAASNQSERTSTTSVQQSLTVTGQVVDNQGVSLPGVTVVLKGTTQGTITDFDGNYSLPNVSSDGTLVFSFVGMLDVEIPVNGQIAINTTMEEETIGLDEVVAVGYGVQKKSSLTGAVASVKTEELENRSVNNVGKAVQGKISGVQVVSMSGAPGSSPEFRVRGYSNNSTSDPLYIVDGLQVDDIAYLDPSSIGSIEVLKDAASAAIYGAQAGNGVVLITTKTGSAGSSRFFYNGMYTLQSQRDKLEMMNADQYKTFWMEQGQPETAFQNGNTDWNSLIIEDGMRLNHTLGFEGGTEKASFYGALTYNKDDGMIVGDSDTYERIAVQVNASYQVNSWMKVGTTNSIERAKIVSVSENNFTASGSAVGGAYFYDPTVPANYTNDADAPSSLGLLDAEANGFPVNRNSEGQLYGGSLLLQSNLWNPYLMIDNYTNEEWRSNINGTAYAEFKPIEGLVYTSRVGYRFGTNSTSNYSEPFYHNNNQSLPYGGLDAEMSHNFYYQWENFANYSFSLADHDITAMAGMQYTSNNNTNVGGETDHLDSEAENYRFLEYSTADANDNVLGDNIDRRSIAYFGRLDWNYDDRYMIQGSFRADAYDASKLSQTNRWGYFPSASAGWTISNENFIKESGFDALSHFKIRGSWGINGNVNVLDNYPYSPSLSLGENYYSFTNQLISAATPSDQLPNPELVWEKSKQTDIGIDTRFFNNRLNFSVDYFHKITDGLLAPGPAPVVSGTSSVMRNTGKIENSGLEFDFGWRDEIGDFNYSITGNFSTLHNEVLESPYGDGRQAGGGGFLTGGTYFEKGHPIWYIRTNIIDHIDETNGQPIYKSAEELGTDDGMAPVGSSIPDFTYGITLTAEYKGFDMRIFGSGQSGSELMWGIVRPDLPLINMPSFLYNDRWTPENSVNALQPSPTIYATGFGGIARYAQSDAWVFDNSFFKIKEIQFGYSFPTELISPLNISALRINVSLEDFFTFTKYPGIDPESMAGTQDGTTLPGGLSLGGGMGVDRVQYPAMKQVTFGINVSF